MRKRVKRRSGERNTIFRRGCASTIAALAVVVATSACTIGTTPTSAPSIAVAASTTSAKAAPPTGCPPPSEGVLDCDLQQRIAAANSYIDSRPGTVGYVVRDRVTGASYRSSQAGTSVWTASTIKLAMVVDLFTRDAEGSITLTDTDRAQIGQMLHTSDDDAADALWYRYAGDDHQAFNRRFPTYGLTDLRPVAGFSSYFPYWGFQKCTPDDLDRLMQYVLTELAPTDRDYIVDQLRTVDPVQ